MEKSSKQNPLVIAGYLFAFFGGFLGLIIGLILRYSTGSIDNGKKEFLYDDKIRKEAKIIIWISVVVSLIFLTRNLIRVGVI